jgi:hypothetical protein
MPNKQTYEKKVEKKLYLFKWQIEALQILEEHAEESAQRNISNQINFLKQKQKALEVKFQAFRETDGIVWQEMKKGIDALEEDMMLSISKAHTEFIETIY